MYSIDKELYPWHQLGQGLPRGQHKCLREANLPQTECLVASVLHEGEGASDSVGSPCLLIPEYPLQVTLSLVEIAELLRYTNAPLPEVFKLLYWVAYVACVHYECH